MSPSTCQLPDGLVDAMRHFSAIDAIYLYGSRAKGNARDDSDWDLAVIYTDYETDLLERAVRPQMIEAELERLYPELELSVVDLREVPVPLQWNIIQGMKLFDRYVPAVRRLEHAIISAWEKDYER
ncbi:type VII toxin-antitoxin system MntA family adenylyltransferase antitoxin [Endozoicomonas sp. 2B-B]